MWVQKQGSIFAVLCDNGDTVKRVGQTFHLKIRELQQTGTVFRFRGGVGSYEKFTQRAVKFINISCIGFSPVFLFQGQGDTVSDGSD